MCFTRALGMGDRARSDIPRTSLPEAPSEKACTAHRALGRCPVPHATWKKPGAFCSMPVICPHRTCLPSSAGGGALRSCSGLPLCWCPRNASENASASGFAARQPVLSSSQLSRRRCITVPLSVKFAGDGRARLVCSPSIDPSRRSGPPGFCAVLIAYLQASDSKTPRS